MMPLDPYFTSNGARDFTVNGHPRATYTAAEQAEVNQMLALPEIEKVKLACDLFEKLHVGIRISRVELRFREIMRLRYYARKRLPLHLVAHPPVASSVATALRAVPVAMSSAQAARLLAIGLEKP